jgi:hypothetical protein
MSDAANNARIEDRSRIGATGMAKEATGIDEQRELISCASGPALR